MTRLFSVAALALVLFASGCGYVNKLNPFAGPTPQEVEETNRKLKVADELVQKWANKLQPEDRGAFIKHEGLTEADPWGNYLRVEMSQDYFEAVLIVRSAGPDGSYGNADDLTRERRCRNIFGVWRGLGWMFWVPAIWVLSSVLTLWMVSWHRERRTRRGRGRKRRHPVLTNFVIILFAPVVCALYLVASLIVGLGQLFGGDGIDVPDVGDLFDGGGFDGFDLD
ncbi:MAG: hypothetical protein K2W95_25305 [Candidatus Obscuribacterales bacterium]|nr:hypothetical protein [Candidatus Obscuribacterales bacterium]